MTYFVWMKRLLSVTLFFVIASTLYARTHQSSYPYLSGDTFRAFADHVVDETSIVKPSETRYGDVIYIKTDYLGQFFSYLYPQIQNPFVLITGNSDYSVPAYFERFLDENKILAWYGMNKVGSVHPKMHSLPIGFANRSWGHGNLDVITEMDKRKQDFPKPILLYMNFLIQTYPTERNIVHDKFKNLSFCTARQGLTYPEYLNDIASSKFVLSPRGNGLDCHRTWEALVMGAIPIVTSSDLDPLFEGLPVLIIQNWDEVTAEFLEAKWEEMSHKEYNLEKRYADYWFDQIRSHGNTQ